jgi:hypothetical protein
MKNLTRQQKELVDGIISEFESINKKCSVTECDDLIAMIDGAIDEKERFRNEIRVSNKSYDDANRIQVLDYICKMNALLNRYGYDCELKYESRTGTDRNYAEYYQVKINWHGHSRNGHSHIVDYTEIYFNTRDALNHNLWHIKEVGVNITLGYREKTFITFEELMNHVAQLIIKHKQSLIK